MSIYRELRSFSQLAIPVIVAELAYGGSSFVAVMMTARLGTDELAASALVLSIFLTVMSLCWGVISVVAVFVAQHHAANESSQVGVVVRHGFLLTLLLSLLVMLIFWWAPFFMSYLGQKPQIVFLSKQYLHALMWSVLPDLGTSLLEQFLFGVLCPMVATLSAVALFALTSVLGYVFVFGKLGVSPMGLVGLGWARTLGAIIVFGLTVLYVSRQSYLKKFSVFTTGQQWSKKIMSELLKVGLPIGFSSIIEVSCFMVIAVFMGWVAHGTTAQAAYQIVLQFVEIGLIVVLGLAQAGAIAVGSVIGAMEHQRLKKVSLVSLGFPVFFVLLVVSLYWFFPRELISLDLNVHHVKNAALVEVAIPFLILGGCFQLLDSIRVIASGVLRAFRDTQYLMWQTVVCFWFIAIPAGYYLAFTIGLGGLGLIAGLVIGASMGAVIALLRLYKIFHENELRLFSNSSGSGGRLLPTIGPV